jgi:alcohol dehydrogenase (cytochrome c)
MSTRRTRVDDGGPPRARRLPASLGAVLAAAMLAACGSSATRTAPNVGWPLWGNNTQNTRYSALRQVDADDLGRLEPVWSRGEGFAQDDWETFPIVIGTTMYYTTDTDEVIAVDAATGALRWSYAPPIDPLLGPQGIEAAPVSRGVTVGGGRVYELTVDDQLIALEASSGRRLWSVQVADPNLGYTENSPGTLWNGELIVGGPAGDAGLRGFVAAYSAGAGRELWRTYVAPAHGGKGWVGRQPANGGADVWMPPTVDPASGTVYVATGNPTPGFTDKPRPGCDPYADATLALDARDGHIEWAHTELCDDSWDYDTDQSPMLLALRSGGRKLDAVGDASKSGFYSILDASDGALIARTPYLTRYSRPHLRPTSAGTVVCPGIFGGLEYGPPAYDPARHAIYVPGTNMCMRYTVESPAALARHRAGSADLAGTAVQVGPATGVVSAVDPDDGRVRWQRALPRPAVAGALATAGGVVFVGDDDGFLYGLDSATGRILWRYRIGLRFGSAAIAYRIEGVEYIAVAAGGSQLNVSGDAPGGEGRLVVLALRGS